MKAYPITPVPYVRRTRADRYKERPEVLNYYAFFDEVRFRRVTIKPYDAITFVLPMPKSWSKKKRARLEGEPHTQRPDLDNLLKALMDAIYKEDSHIHALASVSKIWGAEGRIIVISEETKCQV